MRCYMDRRKAPSEGDMARAIILTSRIEDGGDQIARDKARHELLTVLIQLAFKNLEKRGAPGVPAWDV
jgi:hypothetical protein